MSTLSSAELFQTLLSSMGYTLDFSDYTRAGNLASERLIEGLWEDFLDDVDEETRKVYTRATLPYKILAVRYGKTRFADFLNKLNDKIKSDASLTTQYDDVWDYGYALADQLYTMQQNGVDYGTDTAYNFTLNFQNAIKSIIDSALSIGFVGSFASAITKHMADNGCNFTFNAESFASSLNYFIESYKNEYSNIHLRMGYRQSTYEGATVRYFVYYFFMHNNEQNIIEGRTTARGNVVLNPHIQVEGVDTYFPCLVFGLKTGESSVKPSGDRDACIGDATDSGFGYFDYPLIIPNKYVDTTRDSVGFLGSVLITESGTKYTDFKISDYTEKIVNVHTGEEERDEGVIYRPNVWDAIRNGVLVGANAITDAVAVAQDATIVTNREKAEDIAVTPVIDFPAVIGAGVASIGSDIADIAEEIIAQNPSFPVTPSIESFDTTGNSLFTLYHVTPSQLNSLADYLWSTLPIDAFKKLFSSPADSLISLVGYPVSVKHGGAKNIKIGYADSGVASNVITDYVQEFNLGSINVPAYYNNFLDNNPYTKVSIYLPFIGSCNLDADLVIGSTLGIKYRIEMLTGNCMALITVTSINGSYPIYQFNGNVAMQFPLSAGSYGSLYRNILTTGVSVAGAIATKGASTSLAIASGANTVIGSKADISKSGNAGGSAGYCGILQPYVIVERPVTDIPSNYSYYNGTVTNVTTTIGTLNGYCEMESVDVDNVTCTESEKAMLTDLLLTGFYV